MLSYIIKRILSLIPTLFVVSVVVFLVVYMIPGGPATALLGMEATPEAIADLNAQLGFDRPFFVQYADWFMICSMVTGDSPISFRQPYWMPLENTLFRLSAWRFLHSSYLW